MENSGVYEIVNTVNGHKYIGSAVNIKSRWRSHFYHLNKNKHHSSHLQNAWNKFGADCFEFSVVEYCDKAKLIEREQFYIDKEKPSYNICQTAGSCLGRITSDEARRKISMARTGTHPSEEALCKISGANNHNFGRPLSAKTRAKMGEAHTGNTNMLGKHLTSETRVKMSKAHIDKPSGMLGRRYTTESLLKISGTLNHNFGKHPTEEARAKMSEAHKGALNPNFNKHPSEATIAKISESMKRYWASKRAAENANDQNKQEVYDVRA